MSKKIQAVRFFGYKEGDVWLAFCLEFNLAAQANSAEEVHEKILSMANEYIHDAIAGEDQQYREQLLNRKAPLSIYIKYYSVLLRHSWNQIVSHVDSVFTKMVSFDGSKLGNINGERHA